MTEAQLGALLVELLALPKEAEWVEFKHNNVNPEPIGEYVSALANSAALHDKDRGYLVWGVEDGTHRVVGTAFRPRQAKKGNEELENWLMRLLEPQVNFKIHEFTHDGHRVVLFEVPPATHAPVAFQGVEYIRVGGLKKKLKEYPGKEAELWAHFSRTPFENGIARADVTADEILSLIDSSGALDLLGIASPTNRAGVFGRLADERVIVRRSAGRFDVTNLGAILFAKNLASFDRLGRKALRIIKYRGNSRSDREREWRDPPAEKGYALAFAPALAFIRSQLPQNEPIGQALRTEVQMYPEIAVRELVANALIHQDFAVTGAGPTVEIFADRLEIQNPGEPLVDTLRFIDTPPRSRNEALAALMRRMGMCEEAGSGIDKVVEAVESYQLPPPDFAVSLGFTRAVLFAHQRLSGMLPEDRVRACYQHACLCYVLNRPMTNASLRKRFGIDDRDLAKASRIIAETVKAGLIKLKDPEARRKNARYVPFWG
jgi:predicted HTH transcriptional regulator